MKQQKFLAINKLNEIYKETVDKLNKHTKETLPEGNEDFLKNAIKVVTHVRNVFRTYLNYNRTMAFHHNGELGKDSPITTIYIGSLKIVYTLVPIPYRSLNVNDTFPEKVEYLPNWEKHQNYLGDTTDMVLESNDIPNSVENILMDFFDTIHDFAEDSFSFRIDDKECRYKVCQEIGAVEYKAFDGPTYLTKNKDTKSTNVKPTKKEPTKTLVEQFETVQKELEVLGSMLGKNKWIIQN